MLVVVLHRQYSDTCISTTESYPILDYWSQTYRRLCSNVCCASGGWTNNQWDNQNSAGRKHDIPSRFKCFSNLKGCWRWQTAGGWICCETGLSRLVYQWCSFHNNVYGLLCFRPWWCKSTLSIFGLCVNTHHGVKGVPALIFDFVSWQLGIHILAVFKGNRQLRNSPFRSWLQSIFWLLLSTLTWSYSTNLTF